MYNLRQRQKARKELSYNSLLSPIHSAPRVRGWLTGTKENVRGNHLLYRLEQNIINKKISNAKTFFKMGLCPDTGGDISYENFKSYTPLYSLINDFLESKDQKLCFSFVEYFNSSKKKKCVTVKLNKLILKQDVKVQRYTSSEFSKFCFALASGSLVSV